MSLTLGMTGMDPATETALKAAFDDANLRLAERWRLLPEAQAEHVMVDMDSMYGPMSWLRLHAAGKRVVGLTTAPRTQTDYRLGRPFDSDAFAELLRTIAGDRGIELAPVAKMAAVPAPVETDASAKADAAPVAQPAQDAAAAPVATPTPTTAPPTQAAAPTTSESAPPPSPSPTPAPPSEPTLASPVAESAPEPPPASPPRDASLAGWLMPGALSRRVRYARPGGPTLLIDPAARVYHGPTTLKPFATYFDGAVADADFTPLDDAAWARDSAAAGAAQPLLRLQWLGALLAGKGNLLPVHDPAARYRLTKWPQTEREYPRHFRIATAMMKGPATLAEIAAASDIPLGDVADFVNANLATGFAEPFSETPAEPAEPAKPTGLFGRLRGR